MIAEKKLALLNPTTTRYGAVGGGGKPEETPQDIAAALGMMGDSFAREVLCAVGWPDGARLSTKQLDDMLAVRQFGEWKERMDRVTTGQLAVVQAEIAMNGRLAQAKGMLAASLSAMWPPLVQDRYRSVRHAAMLELVSPNTCRECRGHPVISVAGETLECEACDGRGSVPISDRERARRIGVNWSSFKRHWRTVYEWTFGVLSDALTEGRRQFAAALGTRDGS
jgi:hypothetical protein